MHIHRASRAAALAVAFGALSAPLAGAQQDLRSPDTRDVPPAAASPGPTDLRSPDVRDAATGRGTSDAPAVTVVRAPSDLPATDGMDWGDAGIGAGGALGLIVLGAGAAAVLAHRRHPDASGRRPAPLG